MSIKENVHPYWRLRAVFFVVFGLVMGASAATLFFAGDSTLDDSGYSLGGRIRFPYYSWGTQLQKSMMADCRVANYACSGDSTKSFAQSGRWAKLIANVRPGDFVAIQFGHNDQKRSNEFYRKERWADPNGRFREIVRDWVAELFKAFKAAGLHTCLDTSLYAPPAAIDALLPVTDLWLPDYKTDDDALHAKYTGVSNAIIKKNLERLVALKANLEVRCLVVPKCTDGTDIVARHRYLASLGIPKKSIIDLEYYDYARSKYHALGMKDTMPPKDERIRIRSTRVGLTPEELRAIGRDSALNLIGMN